MNALVPITCKLPFDDHMWSKSEWLLKDICYFRPGFMKKENEDNGEEIDQTHREKKITINRAHLINSYNLRFMGPHSLRDIRLAYNEFIRIDNDIHDVNIPYLFTRVVGGIEYFDIIN